MAPLLEFESVSYAYSSDPVLKDLSFAIHPGEIVAYLGINGAGKTTTFLLSTGLLLPAQGVVRILGQSPSANKKWTHQVGCLMSGDGLYPRLTVQRNLAFFGELYGIKPDLEEHLRKHGLAKYAKRPAGQLSQGYRRRLAMARATLHNPRLLLLDEPADGLDPGATEELHSQLRQFREQGGSVMLTSHRVEEVERLCDRILLLEGGTIVYEGSPADILDGSDKTNLRDLILQRQRFVEGQRG